MRYLTIVAMACGLHAQTWKLDSLTGLQAVHVKAEAATYRGESGLRVVNAVTPEFAGSGLVFLPADFEDGAIQVDVAGLPRQGAMDAARGFIGVAFRIQEDGRYECFYIRPTNGRADDQLRRNHSVQYVAEPDFPWNRLRQESPGVYESYTDLAPGEWMKLRIVVSGVHAQLYVGRAAQPCLIVNDLKHGKTHGKIALWVGPDTEGYFANLAVRK
jgi:hypothetical protein